MEKSADAMADSLARKRAWERQIGEISKLPAELDCDARSGWHVRSCNWSLLASEAAAATASTRAAVKQGAQSALETAKTAGASAELGANAERIYSAYAESGEESRDFSGIIRFVRGE